MEICKICNKNESTTKYGLCESCDLWLIKTWKTKSGRRDLLRLANKRAKTYLDS